MVYPPVVPDPQFTSWPFSSHSKFAGSFDFQVIVCLGLFVRDGLSLVIERTGPVVSKRNMRKSLNIVGSEAPGGNCVLIIHKE